MNQSPDPAAASSPHQNQVTEQNAAADKTKTKHDQMMKDCVAKEQANSATASAEAIKKTCMERMKKPGAKTE